MILEVIKCIIPNKSRYTTEKEQIWVKKDLRKLKADFKNLKKLVPKLQLFLTTCLDNYNVDLDPKDIDKLTKLLKKVDPDVTRILRMYLGMLRNLCLDMEQYERTAEIRVEAVGALINLIHVLKIEVAKLKRVSM